MPNNIILLFLILNILYRYYIRYEIQWYIVPLYIQKLILFLLQRGNKTFGLHVGGLFIASLECFAMVQDILHNILERFYVNKKKQIYFVAASKCICILLHRDVFHEIKK